MLTKEDRQRGAEHANRIFRASNAHRIVQALDKLIEKGRIEIGQLFIRFSPDSVIEEVAGVTLVNFDGLCILLGRFEYTGYKLERFIAVKEYFNLTTEQTAALRASVEGQEPLTCRQRVAELLKQRTGERL